nr:Mu 2 [Phocid orthoreovirus 1]
MAYVAIPATVEAVSPGALRSMLDSFGIRVKDQDVNDAAAFDQRFVVDQFQYMIDGFNAEDVTDALVQRDWNYSSHFVLIPGKQALFEYWATNPSAMPDNLPPVVRKAITRREFSKRKSAGGVLGEFKLSDYFSPLVTPTTEPATMIRLLNTNRLVYTTTERVIGGLVYMYAPRRAYPSSFAYATSRSLVPHQSNVPVFPKAQVVLAMIPSTASSRHAVLDSVKSIHIADGFLRMIFQRCISVHGNVITFVSQEALVSLLQKKRVRSSRKDDCDFARALHLPFTRTFTEGQRDLHRSTVVDVNFDVVSEDRLGDGVSLRLKMTCVPRVILDHLQIVHGDYCIRGPTGMFTDWFLLLSMCSDGIVDRRTGLAHYINPSSTGPGVILNIKITSFTDERPIDTFPAFLDFLKPVGAVLPKGSFKSTVIKILDGIKILGVCPLPKDVVVDSDDVGEHMSPTFENQVIEALCATTGVSDVQALLDYSFAGQMRVSPEKLAQLYPTFLSLLKGVLSKAARTYYDESLAQGRMLVFAHADQELLNANFYGHLLRMKIPYIPEINLLLRANREGGELFQLLLSDLYQMYASCASPQFIGGFLRSLLCPWLNLEPSLLDSDPRLTSATLQWVIPKDVSTLHGWCACNDLKVDFSYVRAAPSILDMLAARNWSQFRASISVTSLPMMSEERAFVAHVIQKGGPVPSKMFSRHACFSLFMRYHVHLDCLCPPGNGFTWSGRLQFNLPTHVEREYQRDLVAEGVEENPGPGCMALLVFLSCCVVTSSYYGPFAEIDSPFGVVGLRPPPKSIPVYNWNRCVMYMLMYSHATTALARHEVTHAGLYADVHCRFDTISSTISVNMHRRRHQVEHSWYQYSRFRTHVRSLTCYDKFYGVKRFSCSQWQVLK